MGIPRWIVKRTVSGLIPPAVTAICLGGTYLLPTAVADTLFHCRLTVVVESVRTIRPLLQEELKAENGAIDGNQKQKIIGAGPVKIVKSSDGGAHLGRGNNKKGGNDEGRCNPLDGAVAVSC